MASFALYLWFLPPSKLSLIKTRNVFLQFAGKQSGIEVRKKNFSLIIALEGQMAAPVSDFPVSKPCLFK